MNSGRSLHLPGSTMRTTPLAAAAFAVLAASSMFLGCSGSSNDIAEEVVDDGSTPPTTGVTPSTCTCNPAGNYPLGQRPVAYPADAAIPDGDLLPQLKSFYDQWKQTFLVDACGGKVVVFEGLDAAISGQKPITVSEGHGYGMMLLALFAGHDPNAQADFDKMVAVYEKTKIKSNLFSWRLSVVNGDVNNCAGAQQNATDGDMDIAYALLMADRQWGSNCGGLDYLKLAQGVISGIARSNTVDGKYLNLGSWAGASASTARASDFMPDHFKAFRTARPDAWQGIEDYSYSMLATVQHPTTGLVPDFIIDAKTAPAVPSGQVLEDDGDDDYDFNACRVPWRIGVDYLMNGDPRAKQFITKLNSFSAGVSGGDPESLVSGYAMDGTPTVSWRAGGEFTGPFGTGATAAGDKAWATALWNHVTGKGVTGRYYGDTVGLLAITAMAGHWWTPAKVVCP